jgi:two-component system capsular synthesis sensor histidine kinase RcsC
MPSWAISSCSGAPGLEAHATRLRALQSSSEGLRGIVNDILDFRR